MKTMIQRTFHPVGQGAFYSERFISDNINIVYDCGTTSSTLKAKESLVTQSFRDDEIINILFISHFDYDHISLIDKLRKTVKGIEKVVIPLLQDDEKVFLFNIYKSLGEEALAKLVRDPREFFGKETQIITVSPGSNEMIEEIKPISMSELRKDVLKIQSGRPLPLNGIKDWVYIPFNYEYKTRSNEFIDKLKKNNIDVKELRENPEYTLSHEIKQKIKKIYKNISGNINENSMFLYSGPLPMKGEIRYFRRAIFCYGYIRCWYYANYNRVACLYTGDGNLQEVKVNKIYKQFWDLIGTIQIPHHGSLSSFDADVLNKFHFLCPISVGKNNLYGHPSQKVMSEILAKESCPILVTEDVDSILVEKIEC